MKQNNNEIVEKFLYRAMINNIKENNVTLTDNTSLRNDIGLDSLKLMETCMESENKLGVKIPNIEIVMCKTYGDLRELLIRKIENK